MQRHARWDVEASPPLPSNLGNFPENSAFLYDQKVGDQFTLKICLEMDSHFWTNSIKFMKFNVGLR